MARKRNESASPDGQQVSLFEVIRMQQEKTGRLEAGSLNIANRLREKLSRGLKECRYSRYEVASRMSEALGVEVTKSQLDSWTAESKEGHRFPAEYLPAFCAVTGYKQPLRMMAELVGCYVLESKEALLAELGRIDQAKRELGRKEKAIREFMKTLD